jgi:hypothetical protein
MTTITIKDGLKEGEYSYNTPLQAVEDILSEIGIVLLRPIENPEILSRVKKHAKENKDRAIDTYDDI